MELNGIDVEGLKGYVESLRKDPSKADRDPVVVAHWEGDSRSRIEMDGRKSLYVGADDEFMAMAGLLGMLAACDVEVVSTHATMIGLEIKDLRVEARGHFNVATLLGIEAPNDAAYQEVLPGRDRSARRHGRADRIPQGEMRTVVTGRRLAAQADPAVFGIRSSQGLKFTSIAHCSIQRHLPKHRPTRRRSARWETKR